MCLKEEAADVLTCCQECTLEYEKEASLIAIHHKSPFHKEHLPYWLKPHANHTLDKEDLDQLKKKYNKQCKNLHHVGRNHPFYNSKNPNTSTLFADSDTISFSYPSLKAGASTLPRFRRQQSCHIEFSFTEHRAREPNLDSLKMTEDKEVKITLALGRSCIDEAKHETKALLRDLLKENLPWQSEAIPLIVEELMSRDDNVVVLRGNDNVGKRRVALAAAEAVLGSSDLLLITKARSHEDRLALERALRDHDGKVVVLVEDAEFADPEVIKFLKDGSESNRDSIFILDTNTRCTGASSVIRMRLECTLPHHKRKAEWETGGGRGKRRRGEADEVSSNDLDLNVRADEDEDKGKVGDLSPVSSDLTREIATEAPGSLERFKNRVALNRGPEQDREAREALLREFERAYNEAGGGNGFEVEEEVLGHVWRGMGLYLNSLFGKWLKDIFQTSLDGISSGERDKVSVRLCLVREGEMDGFKGTCLPKRIQVSYIG